MTFLEKNRFNSWDVVLVPFPYTDSTRSVLRPAVVVCSAELPRTTGVYYVAMITNAAQQRWSGDVLVSDLQMAGLPIASLVRSAKVATIDRGAVIKQLGTLPKSDRAKVATALRSFLVI
jgi:mRNA interferase MazF